MENIILTFDGGGKTGKTTTGIALAERLTKELGDTLGNFSFFSAGYLYRAVTHHMTVIKKIAPSKAKPEDLNELNIGYDRTKYRLKINGLDVHEEINTQGVALQVTDYAKISFVRDWVNSLLLKITSTGNWIVEGRSMYSVFKNPFMRFFFTCIPEIKARREAEAKGIVCENAIQEMVEALIKRDKADSERKLQPLKAAPGSIPVDTSHTSIDDQVEYIINCTGLLAT